MSNIIRTWRTTRDSFPMSVCANNICMYIRFPLRLDYDFQHLTERPVSITYQP